MRSLLYLYLSEATAVSSPGPARTLIHPVFPPQLEARARETLSVILMQLGALPGARPEHLEGLRICVNVMADAILDGPGSLFDPSDPVQLREHQYAHPARVAQLAMLFTHLAGGQRGTCGLPAPRRCS